MPLSRADRPVMDRPPPSARARSDRGGIVLGWLVRLVVVMVAVGLPAFDGLSILAANVRVQDDADTAASAASEAYREAPDAQQALLAAEDSVADRSTTTVEPGSFSVTPDGTVTLSVERTASTLLVRRVDRISSWSDVSAHATARAAE